MPIAVTDPHATGAMPPRHIALAVAVAAVWGLNFVVIDVGLHHFPPLLFCALRFAACAVPAIFFIGRPQVAWRWVLAVGVVLGVVKFGLLFIGMHLGMPAGLSSLVLQVQAVFTALFAAVLLHERPTRRRLAGMTVAFAGITLAGIDHGMRGPIGAFALVIGSAAAWGLSNVLTRKASPPDMLRWMVWVSAVPPLPLLALSLLFEGARTDLEALRTMTPIAVGAIAYIAVGATLFGFGAWGFLLRAHDASAVAPYSLLVPVFGISSAWLLLGERISPLAACAAGLVIVGVGLTALRPGLLPVRRALAQVAVGVGLTRIRTTGRPVFGVGLRRRGLDTTSLAHTTHCAPRPTLGSTPRAADHVGR